MIAGLGYVGIICDNLMKMQNCYTRVVSLICTDEDLELSSSFLSTVPEHEYYELNFGRSRGPDHPDGAKMWL